MNISGTLANPNSSWTPRTFANQVFNLRIAITYNLSLNEGEKDFIALCMDIPQLAPQFLPVAANVREDFWISIADRATSPHARTSALFYALQSRIAHGGADLVGSMNRLAESAPTVGEYWCRAVVESLTVDCGRVGRMALLSVAVDDLRKRFLVSQYEDLRIGSQMAVEALQGSSTCQCHN
ncbi:hypothetical protein [Corynebacterium crudilactis]|nr:hypothetical protein [Corynebacterium crudilactis]